MSLFSKNLRFLRKRGNHLQDEISRLVNKRSNTIGNWENKKSEPSLTELISIADFFKVSLEDLLNTDLEKQSILQSNKTAPGPGEPQLKHYPLTESENSLAREAGSDSFWLILRELRQLNDKVDLLVNGIGSLPNKVNSDKSNH